MGLVNRLWATSQTMQRTLTLSIIDDVLDELFPSTGGVIKLDDIQRVVCDEFGLDPDVLRSDQRARSVSHPRMLAMWLARKHTHAALDGDWRILWTPQPQYGLVGTAQGRGLGAERPTGQVRPHKLRCPRAAVAFGTQSSRLAVCAECSTLRRVAAPRHDLRSSTSTTPKVAALAVWGRLVGRVQANLVMPGIAT